MQIIYKYIVFKIALAIEVVPFFFQGRWNQSFNSEDKELYDNN